MCSGKCTQIQQAFVSLHQEEGGGVHEAVPPSCGTECVCVCFSSFFYSHSFSELSPAARNQLSCLVSCSCFFCHSSDLSLLVLAYKWFSVCFGDVDQPITRARKISVEDEGSDSDGQSSDRPLLQILPQRKRVFWKKVCRGFWKIIHVSLFVRHMHHNFSSNEYGNPNIYG